MSDLERLIPIIVGLFVIALLQKSVVRVSKMIRTTAEAARRARESGMDIQTAVHRAQQAQVQRMQERRAKKNPVLGLIGSMAAAIILSYFTWSWMTEIPAPTSVSPQFASYWRYLTIALPPVMVAVVRLRRFSVVRTASSSGMHTIRPSTGLEMLERLVLPVAFLLALTSVILWVSLAYAGV